MHHQSAVMTISKQQVRIYWIVLNGKYLERYLC